MLGNLGNMPAQIAQAIFFDVDTIEQDLPVFVVIKARYQAGQRRLATSRAPDQGDHLPRHRGEADIAQYFALSTRIGERQVTHIQLAGDVFALDRTVVHFRLDIQLLKYAFCTGDASLNGRADLGKLANRLGQ
ncbi:hypothetical protein D3C76_1500770 [compost metagenome]